MARIIMGTDDRPMGYVAKDVQQTVQVPTDFEFRLFAFDSGQGLAGTYRDFSIRVSRKRLKDKPCPHGSVATESLR